MVGGWIKKHWRAIPGAILLLEPIGRALAWTLRTGGDIDFVVERAKDPGWVRSVIEYALNLPPWTTALLLVAGFAFLFWDSRRNRVPVMAEAVAQTPVKARTTSDYDIPLKLQAIDEARAILKDNADFEQPIDDAGRASGRAIKEIKAGNANNYMLEVNEIRKRFIETGKRIAAIAERYQHYSDISAVLNQNYQRPLFDAFTDYIAMLQKIGNPPPTNVDFFVTPYVDKFQQGISAAGAWRTATLRKLLELRQELSS